MAINPTVTDPALQARVCEALTAALGERAATIRVAVTRGVATLTGVVAECRDKFSAAGQAGAVAGVLGVNDRLQVPDTGARECGDDSTAHACAAAVTAGQTVPCGGVHLMRHALVRLARAAANRLDAEAAQRAAAAPAVSSDRPRGTTAR